MQYNFSETLDILEKIKEKWENSRIINVDGRFLTCYYSPFGVWVSNCYNDEPIR